MSAEMINKSLLKCEAEKLLKEKQEQIAALKSQLDSQQANLPEVPQFVAKWLDKKPSKRINKIDF